MNKKDLVEEAAQRALKAVRSGKNNQPEFTKEELDLRWERFLEIGRKNMEFLKCSVLKPIYKNDKKNDK